MTVIRYLPVRLPGVSREAAAGAAGVHPELLERFVELGLISARYDRTGVLRFPPDTPARVQMIMRLRADFSLNYAGIALVLDLLARIETLENQRTIRSEGVRPWI